MRLSLSTGPLPRLLAPGAPDWIGADGTRVGWALRDRLFLLRDDHVAVVELPDLVEEIAPGPTRWTVALGAGFVRIDPVMARVEELLLDDEAAPVATRAGEALGLFVEVPEHRLLHLVDGRPLPLPDGAIRSRFVRPWQTGVGACWVDLDVILRMGARVSVVGRAQRTEGLAVGPEGALLVRGASDTWVAAPKGLAVRVGRLLDADSARFSPDGASVLAAAADGVVWVDLATGEVRKSWPGSLAPVGFAPDPVLWDLDRGALTDATGAVRLDGFAGAAPAAAGSVLAGPGGAVWDLNTGARGRADLRDGVCATDGTVTVHVDDTHAHVLGGASFPHGLCADDDVVDHAALDGDTLVVATLDGEVGRFALDGAPRGRTRRKSPPRPARAAPPPGVILPDEDEESYVRVADARFPVPADGAARAGDAVWAWTDEGALFALPVG